MYLSLKNHQIKAKIESKFYVLVINIYNYPQNTVLISFVRPGKSFRYNTDKEWRTHV